MRILVVEDDRQTAEMVKRWLATESYAVDIASNAAEAETFTEAYTYDLIILDLILPDRDGVELCKELRREDNNCPILMLTGRTNTRDKINGLDAGADDYLTKPFELEELSARLRALLRRDKPQKTCVIKSGDLILDTAKFEVRRNGCVIDVRGKEYAMLRYFMLHPDTVITRKMLEEHVWNMSLNSESNLIDVYINRLRGKIDGNTPDSRLETIRGIGYKFKSSI